MHALAKGLEILAAFSEGEMLGNQDLADRTGMPKATVSRMTSTLVELGYLRTDSQSRKLFMGTRLLGIGATVQRNIGLQRTARPFMAALSAEAAITVALGTRDRLGITLLEVLRPATTVVTNFDVGSALPLPSTAIGLAYIVAAPVKERAAILEGLRARDPDDWQRIRSVIEKAHKDYKRYGYVISQQSWGVDANGVGVPLTLDDKKNIYVFNCADQASHLSEARIHNEIGPKLLDLVAQVQEALLQPPTTRLLSTRVHQP